MLYFCSCDGIQIFSVNLVFDLFEQLTRDPSFSQKFIKNLTGNTDCKFAHGESVQFPNLACLSLRLVMVTYNLSVVPLVLVLGLSSLIILELTA